MTGAITGIYILGAGGHGRELSSYMADLQFAGWEGRLLGYLDDGIEPGRHGRLQVLGTIDGALDLSGSYITAFGANPLRHPA